MVLEQIYLYLVSHKFFYVLLSSSTLFALLSFLRHILLKPLKSLSEKTANKIDDILYHAVYKFSGVFLFSLAVFISMHYFYFGDNEILQLVDKISFFIIIVYIIDLSKTAIDIIAEDIIEKNKKEDGDKEIVYIGASLVKYLLVVVAILFLLSNLGFEIGPLLAGASIGGIAIAFAMQNILSDIFASFSIYFDKPFRVGDYIMLGDKQNIAGIVKKIGIKSTRLQSLQGEEIIISNRLLTDSIVNNFKRMQKRRAVFQFGVEYSTDINKVKLIPEIIKNTIAAIPDLELDRANFITFGDYALIFEVAYFINSNSYAVFTAKQEQINLKLMEEFKKHEISFAFPTKVVYLQNKS
mgnify:CR=1 FL=1